MNPWVTEPAHLPLSPPGASIRRCGLGDPSRKFSKQAHSHTDTHTQPRAHTHTLTVTWRSLKGGTVRTALFLRPYRLTHAHSTHVCGAQASDTASYRLGEEGSVDYQMRVASAALPLSFSPALTYPPPLTHTPHPANGFPCAGDGSNGDRGWPWWWRLRQSPSSLSPPSLLGRLFSGAPPALLIGDGTRSHVWSLTLWLYCVAPSV